MNGCALVDASSSDGEEEGPNGGKRETGRRNDETIASFPSMREREEEEGEGDDVSGKGGGDLR